MSTESTAGFYAALTGGGNGSRSWGGASTSKSEPRSTAYPDGVQAPVGEGKGKSAVADKKPATYGIEPSNIGFRMLKKAGWSEGEGLGADSQGRKAPVLPHKRPERRGLGAVRGDGSNGTEEQSAPPNKAKRKLAKEMGSVQEKLNPEEQKRRAAALTSHVKRRARDQALQKYVYRSFDDPDATDYNPLLASSKPTQGSASSKPKDEMRSTNPLRFM